MERMEYIEPQLEVIEFENEDIIITSGGIELPDDPAWGK